MMNRRLSFLFALVLYSMCYIFIILSCVIGCFALIFCLVYENDVMDKYVILEIEGGNDA